MDLIIKHPNIPIRGMNQDTLNKFLSSEFKFWLATILNIKAENEPQVDIAIECIKDLCKGNSLSQILQMFDLYTKSKLDIEPITNYIDCVLVGKIVKSYRSYQNRLNKKPVDSDQYKHDIDINMIIMLFDHFVQEDSIPDNFVWVYTYLNSKDILVPSNDLKKRKFEIAKDKVQDKELAKVMAKISILEDYFRKLNIQGNHIKDRI